MAITPIDRDVEAMLCKSQLGYFGGERENVGKLLEDWLEKMDDYFDLTHSSQKNKAMMAASSLKSWQNYGGKITARKVV